MFGLKKKRRTYEVRKLSRIELSDDDILVIHCEEPLTKGSAESLQADLKKLFGYRREIVVLDKGVYMTVIGRQKDANADSSE